MVTHISGHPSAARRAQVRQRSPVKDQRSTTLPRNQPLAVYIYIIAFVDWCNISRLFVFSIYTVAF